VLCVELKQLPRGSLIESERGVRREVLLPDWTPTVKADPNLTHWECG
jgi:hypothetical protein